VDLFGDVLLVIGAGWALIAAIGIIRLDDVYSRMHAATKSPTLGLLFIAAGAAVHLPLSDALRLVLVTLFVLLTAPVGAHLIGRAVHRSPGDVRIRIDTVDELSADDQDRPPS
jgi:multicomponent Na+:H+ antiporter subunit G